MQLVDFAFLYLFPLRFFVLFFFSLLCAYLLSYCAYNNDELTRYRKTTRYGHVYVVLFKHSIALLFYFSIWFYAVYSFIMALPIQSVCISVIWWNEISSSSSSLNSRFAQRLLLGTAFYSFAIFAFIQFNSIQFISEWCVCVHVFILRTIFSNDDLALIRRACRLLVWVLVVIVLLFFLSDFDFCCCCNTCFVHLCY